jgi:SAM-dependent methyltransferase
MKTDFEREKRWWEEKAAKEERDLADESINRALRWRELERHLDGIETILEVGGGTGAFSVPLARRGFAVTHVDFSPAMIEIARQKAQGLETIRFVEANATDLSCFADSAFDLVLNMDGAISFCGSEAERALLESCRVTRRTVIVTVSNRGAMVPVWAGASLAVVGRFPPAVYAMLEQGEWYQEQSPENPLLAKGMTQDYMGAFKAFLPGELRGLLEAAGLRVLRVGGLGSLAFLCGQDTVERVLTDEDLFEEFVDLCERYDRDILPGGPGTRQRAGLIAVAKRIEI